MRDMATIRSKLHLESLKRHIFLCADQSKAKCAPKEEGLKVWDYLKMRLDELGLSKQGGIFRTKANCLRACVNGPICVVYPEGVWYHSVTIDVMERIISDHLVAGNVVKEFAFHGSLCSLKEPS